MIKSILYTSNPNFVPTTLEQVINFAEENGKFLTCFAKEGSELAKVEIGAHILSNKGNHIYIIDTGHDYSYAKKSAITGIAQIEYPFKEKPATESTSLSDRLKALFMPIEAKDVRISMDGNICVATNQGYVAIDAQNHLTAYQEEFTYPVPIFIISKPKETLAVGDILALDKSYAKVTSIKGDKINAISYTGASKVVRTIKDFLFNQTMVRVVVSLSGNLEGQINPMMLYVLSKESKEDDNLSSLIPFMAMDQKGSAVASNPMIGALLAGKNNVSIKDILMMSMINGINPFSNNTQANHGIIQNNSEMPADEKEGNEATEN